MTDKPKEPEPQVDRVGKFVKRQKGPWVLDVDYGILKDTEESPRPLADCSCCGNRNRLSHVDKAGRLYCGDCIGRLTGEEKPVVKSRAEIARDETVAADNTIIGVITPNSKPISNQVDMTVIVGGKVYDLALRNEECNHLNQKFVDSMKNTKSNFCADCGKIMNYRREKKLEPKGRKEKKSEKLRRNK